jgi:cytochrome c biogenesis protein CcmG, thiol:disulfide interchange protein DsbE
MHALARCRPLLGLMIALSTSLSAAWAVTAEVGEPAPDFSLPSIHAHADPVHLAAYRGKVVYLDFWSAWCAPCRRSMPELNALRNQLPRDGFEVISVNIDAVVADARRFLEQVPVAHPVAVDAARQASARYGVVTVPAGILIDRTGTVREVFTGAAAEDIARLRARVAPLIEGDVIR